jgi:flavorubredoxin
MEARKIRPQVYWVGAVDWDRRLFDGFIPIPDGTSYNSYLVQGSEKTVLIDTVDPTMAEVLIARLDNLGIKAIDYVIINHAEQDHTGTLPRVLEKFPQVKVFCTPKCKVMLRDLLLIPEEKIVTVVDNETISLGDMTLEFIYAPWVHWPETMFTYLREEKILFACDLFASHLATSDLYVGDEAQVYAAAKRYYAGVMMPFRTNIGRHLERLKNYDSNLIATSHGPIYDRPDFILKAYRQWVFGAPRNIVVLPYASMHGSTRQMATYFVDALVQRGVTVKEFALDEVDEGALALALVDAATVVFGTPTMLVGPHPRVAYVALLANALRPKTKFAAIIGSYSWGSRATEEIIKMIPNLKVELLGPVISKGLPKKEDFKALDGLASIIAKKHEEMAKAAS